MVEQPLRHCSEGWGGLRGDGTRLIFQPVSVFRYAPSPEILTVGSLPSAAHAANLPKQRRGLLRRRRSSRKSRRRSRGGTRSGASPSARALRADRQRRRRCPRGPPRSRPSRWLSSWEASPPRRRATTPSWQPRGWPRCAPCRAERRAVQQGSSAASPPPLHHVSPDTPSIVGPAGSTPALNTLLWPLGAGDGGVASRTRSCASGDAAFAWLRL